MKTPPFFSPSPVAQIQLFLAVRSWNSRQKTSSAGSPVTTGVLLTPKKEAVEKKYNQEKRPMILYVRFRRTPGWARQRAGGTVIFFLLVLLYYSIFSLPT